MLKVIIIFGKLFLIIWKWLTYIEMLDVGCCWWLKVFLKEKEVERGEVKRRRFRFVNSHIINFLSMRLFWKGAKSWGDCVWNSHQPCHCPRVSYQCSKGSEKKTMFCRGMKLRDDMMSSDRILLDLNIGCQMQKLLLVPCVTGFPHSFLLYLCSFSFFLKFNK